MHFHENIIALAQENTSFRSVVATHRHAQVVIMALRPGEDIGAEVHTHDQILVIVDGNGSAVLDEKRTALVPGDMVIVPAGVRHNIINGPSGPMKLYTIYAPPEHPDGTVHRTKADAEKAEAEE